MMIVKVRARGGSKIYINTEHKSLWMAEDRGDSIIKSGEIYFDNDPDTLKGFIDAISEIRDDLMRINSECVEANHTLERHPCPLCQCEMTVVPSGDGYEMFHTSNTCIVNKGTVGRPNYNSAKECIEQWNEYCVKLKEEGRI